MYVSDDLRLQSVTVSPSRVGTICLMENMERKYKRLLHLEGEKKGTDVDLTEEQIKLLEKANTCFRGRHAESSYPGYLLSQETFVFCTLKGIGRIYLKAVVDAYGSYAFGKLYPSKLSETALDMLYDRVLPFYKDYGPGLNISNNGRECYGQPMIHPYQIFLEFTEITSRRTKVAIPRTNGFVERFHLRVLEEFLGKLSETSFMLPLRSCKTTWFKWLRSYNYERPPRG